VDRAAVHIRNCGSAVDSCHRRNHGAGRGENLCLYCSRDFLGACPNDPQSESHEGDRQRIRENSTGT
jgi:hypothetical protein